MAASKSDHIALFMDILGFARLTESSERHPHSGITPPMLFGPDSEVPDHITAVGPRIAHATYHFHRALERWLQDYARRRSPTLTAMTFSDSAFVVAQSSVIGTIARRVMRDCLRTRVPVRMGIAKGSFRTIRFRADAASNVQIYSAQFYGTAVMRAHEAEQHGGKGLRIFVHPSMQSDLRSLTRVGASRFIELERPNDAAHWELEYFTDHGGKPWADSSVDEAECRDMWSKLVQMQEAAGKLPTGVRKRAQAHYVQTKAAFNRMCDVLKRPRFT